VEVRHFHHVLQPRRATGGEPVDLPAGRFTVQKTENAIA